MVVANVNKSIQLAQFSYESIEKEESRSRNAQEKPKKDDLPIVRNPHNSYSKNTSVENTQLSPNTQQANKTRKISLWQTI